MKRELAALLRGSTPKKNPLSTHGRPESAACITGSDQQRPTARISRSGRPLRRPRAWWRTNAVAKRACTKRSVMDVREHSMRNGACTKIVEGKNGGRKDGRQKACILGVKKPALKKPLHVARRLVFNDVPCSHTEILAADKEADAAHELELETELEMETSVLSMNCQTNSASARDVAMRAVHHALNATRRAFGTDPSVKCLVDKGVGAANAISMPSLHASGVHASGVHADTQSLTAASGDVLPLENRNAALYAVSVRA